jgi:hypothetical protein
MEWVEGEKKRRREVGKLVDGHGVWNRAGRDGMEW